MIRKPLKQTGSVSKIFGHPETNSTKFRQIMDFSFSNIEPLSPAGNNLFLYCLDLVYKKVTFFFLNFPKIRPSNFDREHVWVFYHQA